MQGGGKMGELIRSTNWEETALGRPDTWPESLKSAVSISLNSGFPIAIYWGEDFTLLYNDAWSSIPGGKHPWALGKPGKIVWPEIWEGLDAEFRSVLERGESIRRPDALLLMKRFGYTEECYFDYTLSPIVATDGSVGGVFNAVIETSYKVISERRNDILVTFLRQLNNARSVPFSLTIIQKILDNARSDISFFLLHVVGNENKEKNYTNLKTPAAIYASWPIGKAISEGRSQHIQDLSSILSEPILNEAGEPCVEALLVPMQEPGSYIVLGASPRKRIDADYKHFFESVSFHIDSFLKSAQSSEQEIVLQREQALNEELAAANEELNAVNDELHCAQENLQKLNDELEERVEQRTIALAESQSRFRNMLQQSPVAMLVFQGEELVVSLANPEMLSLIGKNENVIGHPLAEVLPELKEQSIFEILCQVYQSGESYTGYEHPVAFQKSNGETEVRYFNFTFSPLREDGKITGVLDVAVEVTPQVAARRIVEEKELSLRTLVMTSHNALMILKGPEWTIEIANNGIAELWGKHLQDIIGKTLLEVLPELEGQPFPDLLREVYKTGTPYGQEEEVFYLNTPKGPVKKYVSFYYDPLRDPDGNICGIIVSANDITNLVEGRLMLEESYERQQALNEEVAATNEELAAANEELLSTNEELAIIQDNLHDAISKLTASEARLRYMLADAPVAIAVLVGPELKIESANKKTLELWGKNDSVIGKRLDVALPELEGQPFIGILQDVLKTGESFYGTEVPAFIERNGKLVQAYFNFVYQAIREDDGTISSIMAVGIEVTDQVKARKNIEENEKRVRLLFNAIPQQVWTATPDGSLSYVNNVVSGDLGYESEVVVGHSWQTFIHPDDLPGSLEKWQNALISGQEYLAEFRLLMKSGDYQWHLSRAVPLVEEGEIKFWIGINTNIQFQKDNEQKKDEFLSIASHELKTPLTSIKAFNQLMQRTTEPEKLVNFIRKSAEHIFRLEKLINDLLDVTKINAGKMSYNMEAFNFGKTLMHSVESVQHVSPRHKIIVENCADVTLVGDHLRLEQVMHNFLTNAVKYSPESNKVIVNSVIENESLVVSVQDFGIGIAKDHLDRLFDRYYRVDNTAMRFEGLGLGLFISSEILKRHGGSFWIESEQGQGSTFFFRLPLKDDSAIHPTVKSDTFYEDESITISYREEYGRIDTDWKGFQTLESVKRGCLLMLDMLKKNKCTKVLNDNTNVLGTWSEAADWVGGEWFAMMEEAGLKYFAWVFSHSSFSQLSARKSVDIMTGNVVTQFFTDIEAAANWINEKDISATSTDNGAGIKNAD